ncbi:MAG TPA: beta-ketoacyl-ACP reductase [Solirubrobacteraceae bacterium]|jgi:acetoacetyl-CoA reductase/3-oxoacyl-[acyl-carrier protein] reductase|nr:beta-ketoacyl-ACP reductase [Solirubrobacteraceae bacterium]
MSTSTTTPATLVRRPRLHGKVAFVTGGTRGIGAAICHSLAEQGADVAAGYSRDRDAAESFIGQLTGEGLKGSIHQGNIGSAEDCRRTVAEVIDEHGRLDILVNNAGITIDKTVLKMTDEDWYKVIAVNLSGAFFMSQAALPHMIERGTGRIVNISSIIGETGNIGQANYAASKSGLFGLTKTLALEAARELKKAGKLDDDSPGVTVNTVAPGFIATEMLESIPDKALDGIKAKIPIGRLGRPDEIARVVHFLVADQSSFITGAVWSVNGGMDM